MHELHCSFTYSAFSFLQDGDVGVGVFPEREKVLVSSLCFGGVACHRVGAAELEMCQCSRHKVHYDASVIQQLLELGGCGRAVVSQQVRLAAQVSRVERSRFAVAVGRQVRKARRLPDTQVLAMNCLC
jgi:hypothetical protein